MHKNRNINYRHYAPGVAAKPVFMVDRPAMVTPASSLWPYVCAALVGVISLLIVIITHH